MVCCPAAAAENKANPTESSASRTLRIVCICRTTSRIKNRVPHFSRPFARSESSNFLMRSHFFLQRFQIFLRQRLTRIDLQRAFEMRLGLRGPTHLSQH